MAAAAIPRALTLTRTRRRSAEPENWHGPWPESDTEPGSHALHPVEAAHVAT